MALGPPWWSDISICKPLQFILDKKKWRVTTNVLYLYLYFHSSWCNRGSVLYLDLYFNDIEEDEVFGGCQHVADTCLSIAELLFAPLTTHAIVQRLHCQNCQTMIFSLKKLRVFFFPWQFPFPIYICLLRRELRYWFSGNIFFLQRL